MAFKAKFTAKYGSTNLEQIAITAGATEAQSDTISVNIDATKMSKGEALQLLAKIEEAIHASPWPTLA